MQYLAIALGGAFGSLVRFGIYQFFANITKTYPFATLAVNASGSFIIGLCFVLAVEKSQWSEPMRLFIIVGFLGAFTTFSTFSLENWQLIQQGLFFKTVINIVTQVVSGIVLAWVGMQVARAIF